MKFNFLMKPFQAEPFLNVFSKEYESPAITARLKGTAAFLA